MVLFACGSSEHIDACDNEEEERASHAGFEDQRLEWSLVAALVTLISACILPEEFTGPIISFAICIAEGTHHASIAFCTRSILQIIIYLVVHLEISRASKLTEATYRQVAVFVHHDVALVRLNLVLDLLLLNAIYDDVLRLLSTVSVLLAWLALGCHIEGRFRTLGTKAANLLDFIVEVLALLASFGHDLQESRLSNVPKDWSRVVLSVIQFRYLVLYRPIQRLDRQRMPTTGSSLDCWL